MLDFSTDTLSPEEAERLRSVFEPLTQSVRELMDATARSDADADTIAAAKAEIESATARLRSKQLEKTWGLRFTTEGEWLPWTNAFSYNGPAWSISVEFYLYLLFGLLLFGLFRWRRGVFALIALACSTCVLANADWAGAGGFRGGGGCWYPAPCRPSELPRCQP